MSTEPAPFSPPQVAALLRATATTVQAELEALPAPLAAWHPAPGEWCVNETLGHIIEAERRGFAGRIRQMLASDDPALQTWDQAEVARLRRDCERPVATVLNEFLDLRAGSVALVQGLRPDDLVRGGRHETVGELHVHDLLQEWVHHDRNHVRQMLANVQAAAWPHMGNAQRFSED